MPKQTHVAFLGTSRSGLGHLRRISNIAGHLTRLAPDLRLTLVSNAPPAGLTPADLACFEDLVLCDRSRMSAYLAGSDVALAVLDTLKLTGIGAYSGQAALILRETPQAGVDGFFRDDGRPWDSLIIPNAPDHWMPEVDSGFARRIEAAGWILRPTGVRGAQEQSAGVVLASGGGGTAETRAVLYDLLQQVITRAANRAGQPIRIRQALGPRAGAAALPGVAEVFDPKGDLNAVFRAADLVISTAGYNSVLELASTDTPAMLVPIPRSLDDQAARVRLWGPRLGIGVEPGELDAAAEWLADHVARPRRREPWPLGPDGAARAARILLEMVCRIS